MVFEISRREVLNNLIRFKDNLLEQSSQRERREEQQKEESRQGGKRVYRVLLNRKTGDMRFAKKISEIENHISRKGGKKEIPEDWKEIRIIVQQDNPGQAAHFEVQDAQNQSLKPAEIDPLAWRIASETLDVLNLRAKEVLGQHAEMLPEEAVLKDLSNIHISKEKEQIENFPGWVGSIGRIEAEQILNGKAVGTYLLREGDELTLSISFHFAEENLLEIHPYLVTVVEKEGKISDILLLQTNKGWTLYHDDPDLNDKALYQYFPSLRTLLLKLPLSFPANRSGKQK
jgi:hypothetical protein